MKSLIVRLIITIVVCVGLLGVGETLLTAYEPTVSQSVGVDQALDTDAAHENARAYQKVKGWFYGIPTGIALVFILVMFRKEFCGSTKTQNEETKKEEKV